MTVRAGGVVQPEGRLGQAPLRLRQPRPARGPGYVPAGAATAPTTAAGWRSVDGCTGEPVLSYDSTAPVKLWTSCRSGGRVALVRWDGLAHRWPGTGWVDPDATARLLM